MFFIYAVPKFNLNLGGNKRFDVKDGLVFLCFLFYVLYKIYKNYILMYSIFDFRYILVWIFGLMKSYG